MLTEPQKQAVRDLCRKHKVGMVNFFPDGRIEFMAFNPLKDLVEKTFPALRVIDHGVTAWQSRPDEMKSGYWLIAEPDF